MEETKNIIETQETPVEKTTTVKAKSTSRSKKADKKIKITQKQTYQAYKICAVSNFSYIHYCRWLRDEYGRL